MTKRIRITDPKDLREGMRVEVQFMASLTPVQGELFKPLPNPTCVGLDLDIKGCVTEVITTQQGSFCGRVKSIHRLIDGIEDVVVGDILEDDGGYYVMVLGQADCVYFLSGQSDSLEDMQDPPEEMSYEYTMSKYYLVKTFDIHIPEEPQKTELTETEAKEIIAEQKGVEPEDIIIKKDG